MSIGLDEDVLKSSRVLVSVPCHQAEVLRMVRSDCIRQHGCLQRFAQVHKQGTEGIPSILCRRRSIEFARIRLTEELCPNLIGVLAQEAMKDNDICVVRGCT